MKDNEILDLYWNRDENAIKLTAVTYGKYCYSVAYNILHNNEDAEECVSDTWVNAWNSIPPRRPNRLSTFLGKLTRNIAINRYKQKRGDGQVDIALTELEGCVSSHVDVEQVTDEMVLTEAIDRFLRAQPRIDRNIFIGRYWHLYSITELAKAYNMSESKVTSMLFRMRNKLKIHLEKEGVYV